MAAYLAALAETTNAISGIVIVACLLLVTFLIMRFHHDGGNSSVVHVEHRPVQVAVQKLFVPFTLKIQANYHSHDPGPSTAVLSTTTNSKSSSDTSTSVTVCCGAQCPEGCEVVWWWGVKRDALVNFLHSSWPHFRDNIMEDLAMPEYPTHRAHISEGHHVLELQTNAILELGPSPRTVYPLVVVQLTTAADDATTTLLHCNQVGAVVSILHVPDEANQEPAWIMYQYLKQTTGQLTLVTALYTQANGATSADNINTIRSTNVSCDKSQSPCADLEGNVGDTIKKNPECEHKTAACSSDCLTEPQCRATNVIESETTKEHASLSPTVDELRNTEQGHACDPSASVNSSENDSSIPSDISEPMQSTTKLSHQDDLDDCVSKNVVSNLESKDSEALSEVWDNEFSFETDIAADKIELLKSSDQISSIKCDGKAQLLCNDAVLSTANNSEQIVINSLSSGDADGVLVNIDAGHSSGQEYSAVNSRERLRDNIVHNDNNESAEEDDYGIDDKDNFQLDNRSQIVDDSECNVSPHEISCEINEHFSNAENERRSYKSNINVNEETNKTPGIVNVGTCNATPEILNSVSQEDCINVTEDDEVRYRRRHGTDDSLVTAQSIPKSNETDESVTAATTLPKTESGNKLHKDMKDGDAEGARTFKKRTLFDDVDELSSDECVVCQTNPVRLALLPCRHVCVCRQCFDQLMAAQQSCPLCRSHVSAYFVV